MLAYADAKSGSKVLAALDNIAFRPLYLEYCRVEGVVVVYTLVNKLAQIDIFVVVPPQYRCNRYRVVIDYKAVGDTVLRESYLRIFWSISAYRTACNKEGLDK